MEKSFRVILSVYLVQLIAVISAQNSQHGLTNETEFPTIMTSSGDNINRTKQQQQQQHPNQDIILPAITNYVSDTRLETTDIPMVKEPPAVSEKEPNYVVVVNSTNKNPFDVDEKDTPKPQHSLGIPSSIAAPVVSGGGNQFDETAQSSGVQPTTLATTILIPTTSKTATTTTTVIPTTDRNDLIPPADINASIALIDTKPNRQDSSAPGCPSLEAADEMSQTQLIQALTHECRYDRLERPAIKNDNSQRMPVEVYVRQYIYFLQNLEAHDLQFKIHVLLQLRFVDPRLVFKEVAPTRAQPILGEASLRSALWVPHVFFSNERDSSILGTEDKDILVSISPDGTVIISARIQATLYCWMDLRKFPFDDQTCSTVIESWMYNTSELVLHWEPRSPVTLAPELHLTEYVRLNSWTNETVINADISDLRHGAFAGNYSSLSFTVHLAREMGFYMMDYFLPSMMIVCMSWVSFWIQADQAPPRIMLGTSTMLTFITLATAQGKTLPKVSYIKVSEVWFLGCTGFIFGSLVEFAFVNTIWRRKKNVELKKVNSKYILKSTLTPRPARKEIGLQKSRSCSSLDGSRSPSTPSIPSYNNYLTVHSFHPKSNLPTITTQSADDIRENQNGDLMITIDPSSSVSTLPGDSPISATVDNSKYGWTTMTPQEVAIWIDRRARFFFPCAFIVFNAFFWTFVYYL